MARCASIRNRRTKMFSYSDLRLDLLLQQARLSMTLAAQAWPRVERISGQAKTSLSATAPLEGEVHLDIRRLDWMELLSTDLAGAPAS